MKFYKQEESFDCGPTCLRMLARHYGMKISVQELRSRTQIGKEGVNMLGISEAAESIGFRTHCLKLSLKDLSEKAPLPAILHWNQNHFVVLYKIKNKRLYIADPARGLIQYTKEEFSTRWSAGAGKEEGIALLAECTPAFYQNTHTQDATADTPGIKNITTYLFPFKKMILQLFIGLAVASLLQLILPFLTQSIVDIGINSADINFIYIILAAQLALFIGRITVDFIRSWILLHISSRINISILTDFIAKLMRLPVSFFDSKKTGDIMQRMSDHKRIESFLTGSSLNLIFSMANLIVFVFVLAFFNFNIFIIFLLSSLLYTGWVIIFLKKRKKLDYKRFDVSANMQSSTIQLIQGMQEIKLNGIEQPVRWQWERLQAKLFNLGMSGLSLNQLQQTGALFINEGKNILITFLSAKAVIDGQMTLGTMLAVQYIVGQLNSPIEQLIGFIQGLQNAKISLNRLNELHGLDDEEPASKSFIHELPPGFQREAAATNSAIIFNNVSFTYSGAGNDPVLKNIDLTIPKGKTTAIVGESGSGKTTLLKLLLKFYEPGQGDIRLDKTPLSGISHKYWRSHCGVVMQDSFIFSDTIERNIAVGSAKVNQERLVQAIDIANIGEFIYSLPHGLQTRIGPEGTGLSMGQRQRLLIARAVYKDPQIILLDEATNSLDANNEAIIVKKLQGFLRNKTVIVVAHRLSTVKHADQIVVLDNGVITEMGTHHQLVSGKGRYFTLVKNQLELGI